MATKTKKKSGTTAKIKELTGVKPDKVNEKHLNKMQEIVGDINKVYLELGRLAATNHSYLHELAGRQDKLTLLQEELKTEYGTDDIDINSGSINYPTNGQTN